MSSDVKNPSIWKTENSSRRRICMLMVTHACNLNCGYCYENYKKNSCMDLDLAKKIITAESEFVNTSKNFDELQIDFMGGEPMLNFSLIKNIVEWIEKGSINVPCICYSTTNGTLLSEEIKEWLRKHKDSLILGVSYDGNSQMQAVNRTDKYDINLKFFHELWPTQSLHITLTKKTLPMFAEGILDLQKKGYAVEAALAQGEDWTIEDALIYREQLCILKDAYLNDHNLTPFDGLTRLTDIFNLPATQKIQGKWCGTGKYMVTYDVDGKKYGCHMFTPLVLGKSRALPANEVEWDSPKFTSDNYCKNCVLRSFCPTCLGFNYKDRGDLANRDKRWCPMILAEALTSCEFQVERIAAMDKLTMQDAEHGKFALRAYKILQHLNIEKSKSPYVINDND